MGKAKKLGAQAKHNAKRAATARKVADLNAKLAGIATTQPEVKQVLRPAKRHKTRRPRPSPSAAVMANDAARHMRSIRLE